MFKMVFWGAIFVAGGVLSLTNPQVADFVTQVAEKAMAALTHFREVIS